MKLLKEHNPKGYAAAAKKFQKSFRKLELAINTALYRRAVSLRKAADNLPQLSRRKVELEKQLRSSRSAPSTSKEQVAKLEAELGKLNALIKTATRIDRNPSNLKIIQIAVDGNDAPREEIADSTKVSEIEAELQTMRGKLYPKQVVKESNFSKNLVVEKVYVKLLNRLKL